MSKLPQPFVKEYFCMLVLIMMIPFFWGVGNVGMKGGIFGAVLAGSMLSCIWFYSCYKQGMKCLQESQHIAWMRLADKHQEQDSHRVTIAQNKELTSELDAIKPFIESLLGENGRLTKEVTEAATKDVLIQALRRRAENLNAEYHNKVFPRATTLEDVRKLTGEDNV
jgi:hypothetical protein